MALLLECRQIFEKANEIGSLAKVLGSLAQVEDARGHSDVATDLGRDALRYAYLAGDISTIVASHYNRAEQLLRSERELGSPLAHRLAATLIKALAGADVDAEMYRVAADLIDVGRNAAMPSNLEDLFGMLADVPGVDLQSLLSRQFSDLSTAQQTLQALLANIRTLTSTLLTELSPYLATWDPIIAALLAANNGDEQAGAALDTILADYEDSNEWAELVVAMRRVRAGETGPRLFVGLSALHSAIMTRILDARDGKIPVPIALWRAAGISSLLGEIVKSANGSGDEARSARQSLETMAGAPGLARLAAALSRILDGDRNPNLAAQLGDPTEGAVVATVLQHIRR